MIDNLSFMFNSLFCEFAYVINLDTEMLEIYFGWQREKGIGRYVGNSANKGYWGVSLVKEYPLNNIPYNWLEEVNKILEDN